VSKSNLIKRSLKQHEEVIADGMRSFLYVGQSLMAIRDERLYEGHYDSFEAYCKDRWNLAKSHAYRMIEAADVVSELSPIGDAKTENPKQETAIPLPKNEAQARALAESADTPEERREVWAKAVEIAPKNEAGEPQVTAKIINQVADEVVGPKVETPKPPKAEKPQSVVEVVKEPESDYNPGFDPRQFDPAMKSDEPEEESEPTGEIPKHLTDVIAGVKQYKSLQREVSLLMGKVHALIALPVGSFIRHQEIEQHINQVKADLRAWGFGENCPTCQNKPDKKCLKCKGRGWIAQGQMGALSDWDKEWLAKNGVSK